MDLKITNKATGYCYNFWAPSSGGYIRLVTAERPGTLGQQIAINGHCLSCHDLASFKRECRRWYRIEAKAIKELAS